MTVKELSALFEVTDRTIQKWVENGMPRSARGEYVLKECFDWWMENINSEGTEEEKSVRDRYWAAKAENEEIKLAKSKEQVVLVGKVAEAWAGRAMNLRTALHAQPYRVASKLEGKSQDEIINILMEENNEMLRNFCRASSYTPEVQEAEEADKKDKKAKAKSRSKSEKTGKAEKAAAKSGSAVKKSSAKKKKATVKKTAKKVPVGKASVKKAVRKK